MTDTADYLLSRITETSVSIGWDDIIWKVGLVSLAVGIAFIVIGVIMNRRERENYYCPGDAPIIIGVFVAVLGAAAALGGYACMLYDRDILSGLVASYEALYGPLPEGIL